MPLKTTGVAIGWICWPISGASGEFVATGATSDVEVTAGFGRAGFQFVLAKDVNETGRAWVVPGLFLPCSNISIICLIGVMPQMGSFENGKLYAIAPTNLLSMKTGEPDMPANTPVLSTLGPESLAMMVDCRGPVKPDKTPKISKLKSSGSLPAKTVRATPFIPGFKSSSGKSAMFGIAALVVLFDFIWPKAQVEMVSSANANVSAET